MTPRPLYRESHCLKLTMILLFLQTVLVFASSKQGGIDEEISLKRKLFESKRYDNEVIQYRWRKTVEGDIENIGKF